jgi:hypothetical protein
MIGRMISMSVRDTTVINFAKHQLFRISCRPHDISILLDKETGSIKLADFALHGSGYATKIESKSRDERSTIKSGDSRSFCEVE